MTKIRLYEAEKDAAALRSLFVELHERERAIEPRMRPSEAIADDYLTTLFERAEKWDGVVLVAERAAGDTPAKAIAAKPSEGAATDLGGEEAAGPEAHHLLGFVAVLRRYVSEELDDPPGEMGYVSDLVVTANARGYGAGRALLGAAEQVVQEAGVSTLRLSVLAGNEEALGLYESEGFAAVEHELEKLLN